MKPAEIFDAVTAVLMHGDELLIVQRQPYLRAFPGYYVTADAGYKDEDGYLWIMSRTDDIINVAGHRLSTGAMEEVLASHPDAMVREGRGTNEGTLWRRADVGRAASGELLPRLTRKLGRR